MRKLLLMLTIFSMIVSSCGDKKSKQIKEDANSRDSVISTPTKQKKVIKTIAQRLEEGIEVRAELSRFAMQIPDTLLYSETTINNMGFKKHVFIAEKVDENLKNQLEKWVVNQSKDLEKAKWEKTTLQKDAEISGLIFNSAAFKKERGGESTQSDVLNLTSVYDPNKENFIIYIKPYII